MRALAKSISALALLICLRVEATGGTLQEVNASDYLGSVVGWGVKGKILTAKTWMESGDSNVIIISELQRGQTFDKDYASAVYACQFANKAGRWKKIWSIQEVNRSSTEIIRCDSSSLRIVDVDGNGMAETLFFYTIGYDSGTEPANLKMMFHWNRVKAPIRGKIPVELGQQSAYEMKLDAKLSSAPNGIREFAVQQWISYVKAHYEENVGSP